MSVARIGFIVVAVALLARTAWGTAGAQDNGEETESPLTARKLLALYGADASHLRKLVSGRPIVAEETETLWRSLHALRRFTVMDLHWLTDRRTTALVDALANPGEAQGALIEWSGELREVKVGRTLPEVARRFEIEKFYECLVTIEGKPATVYALSIPKRWRNGAELPTLERVGGTFVALKNQGNDEAPEGVFVTLRLEWFPNSPLGELDIDRSLFDEATDDEALTAQDREGFYQALAAVERASADDLHAKAVAATEALAKAYSPKAVLADRKERQSKIPTPPPPRFDLETLLFNDPGFVRGELFHFEGVARRVTRIEVSAKDIRERFGLTHYYQIDVFTPGSRDNPLALCVPSLPSGLVPSERLMQDVACSGFFFKKWAYVAGAPLAIDEHDQEVGLQLAPLLIGPAPRLVAREPISTEGSWLGALAVLGSAGVIVAAIFFWRRSDAAYRRKRNDRRAARV